LAHLGATEGFAVTEVVPNDIESCAPDLADDLLWGAADIAQFIGISRNQVYWFAKKGIIPHKKCGGVIVGSRAALRHALTGSPKIPANAA
jgi:hypothetical protein